MATSCSCEDGGSSDVRAAMISAMAFSMAAEEKKKSDDPTAMAAVSSATSPLTAAHAQSPQPAAAHDLPDITSLGGAELLSRFTRLQEARVAEYAAFDRDFRTLLSSGDMVAYRRSCAAVTERFSFLSACVKAVASALRAAGNAAGNAAGSAAGSADPSDAADSADSPAGSPSVLGAAAEGKEAAAATSARAATNGDGGILAKCAACIDTVQTHEQQKLQLTAQGQILQQALAGGSLNEDDGEPALQELRGLLANEVEAINDLLEEVTCAKYELALDE